MSEGTVYHVVDGGKMIWKLPDKGASFFECEECGAHWDGRESGVVSYWKTAEKQR